MLPCTFQSERTPLHLAAEHGGRDVVLLLLQSGADVNIQDDVSHGRAGRGLYSKRISRARDNTFYSIWAILFMVMQRRLSRGEPGIRIQ